MSRYVKVAAAQMGPNNEGTSREAVVERMLALLDQAIGEGVELLVYPELALTTYFPKRISQPLYPLALAHNELVMRAGAYENSLFVVGCAKAGVEDGVEFIAGSAIVNPLGEVVAQAGTTGDELVAARIDLDQMIPARKRWNFFGRRHPEHYGKLVEPLRP